MLLVISSKFSNPMKSGAVGKKLQFFEDISRMGFVKHLLVLRGVNIITEKIVAIQSNEIGNIFIKFGVY